ncbi:hypothetical protein BpHYR1_039840 [Brachionus plicatilis]|uniref:Uncharacterized protein n=1 Tax=Brachionus plicatilis TaxID=10195 RepID=A0A3M7S8U1_BRAPC|nr:hypothetical protein BpHYR1_039840 [Brachionus plicatilis]
MAEKKTLFVLAIIVHYAHSGHKINYFIVNLSDIITKTTNISFMTWKCEELNFAIIIPSG